MVETQDVDQNPILQDGKTRASSRSKSDLAILAVCWVICTILFFVSDNIPLRIFASAFATAVTVSAVVEIVCWFAGIFKTAPLRRSN